MQDYHLYVGFVVVFIHDFDIILLTALLLDTREQGSIRFVHHGKESLQSAEHCRTRKCFSRMKKISMECEKYGMEHIPLLSGTLVVGIRGLASLDGGTTRSRSSRALVPRSNCKRSLLLSGDFSILCEIRVYQWRIRFRCGVHSQTNFCHRKQA